MFRLNKRLLNNARVMQDDNLNVSGSVTKYKLSWRIIAAYKSTRTPPRPQVVLYFVLILCNRDETHWFKKCFISEAFETNVRSWEGFNRNWDVSSFLIVNNEILYEMSYLKTITDDYGSWWSSIDTNILSSGNCKTISELQCGKMHEYGGGSFIIVDDAPYYITLDGIFRQVAADTEPELIVAGDYSHRFADLCYHKSILYAVYEVHSGNEIENMIVQIIEGAIRPIVTGADFYAFPRVSPNGHWFTWMEWNMPNMPWDETTVVISSIKENYDIDEFCRISRKGVNYHSPEWSPVGNLYLISDHTNWWNIYEVNLTDHKLGENIFPVDAEIGAPLWQFAERHFASNKQDESGTAYAIAAGPTKSSSVIRIELDTKEVNVLRESRSSTDIEKYDISIPESMHFQSDDITVQAWFYPPFSLKNCGYWRTLLDYYYLNEQFLSKTYAAPKNSVSDHEGFAVCDVNYRGSSGFGTIFRNMLRRNWGVMDRNDMINAASHLISQKRVDPKKLCIMGSSAGGYLLLATILKSDLFSAAVSLYGVSDLIGLVKDTHKFERGYNEQLIGKFPEERALYEQRSPLNHIDQLSTPIAFFHGEEDRVVPLTQSMQLHEALKIKGIPTSLTIFPGENHGFKGSFANEITLSGFYYFFCRMLGIKPSVESQASACGREKQKEGYSANATMRISTREVVRHNSPG
ncbi:Peptidase, S9A/B/C family, catalytic domain protein [Dirofilaria immitis]|nr:Peptidase, S9A/B/C family, catalytic domain protein [Dirofilaria immitis]